MHTTTLTVTPAYGRDYRSKAAALADWEAGKDFALQGYGGSGYINQADAARYSPGATVNIRYAKLRRVAVVRA